MQLLPRHVEYFANLRRVSNRPWVTADEHVLHGTRGDRVVVVGRHRHVAQSRRLSESFDKLSDRRRSISVLRSERSRDDCLPGGID